MFSIALETKQNQETSVNSNFFRNPIKTAQPQKMFLRLGETIHGTFLISWLIEWFNIDNGLQIGIVRGFRRENHNQKKGIENGNKGGTPAQDIYT